MTADSGHAPCAFDTLANLAKVNDFNCRLFGSNVLSLATCAKNLRAGVEEGDYVLGIAGSDFGEKANMLVWAGRVSRVIPKSEYFKEFPGRPDNYYGLSGEKYAQLKNPFHDASNMHSDLNPANAVLFEGEWWYFGRNPREIVPEELMAKRQEAKILDEGLVSAFMGSIAWKYPRKTVLGMPMHLDRDYLYNYMAGFFDA